MNHSTENQIEECEEGLRPAMLDSNTSELEELLAPDLVFTNHLGQVITKQNDLEAHQSGKLNIQEITLSDQKIKFLDRVAIVSVKAQILGSYDGVESKSDFRFTRVWSNSSSKTWQVIAGHSSIVV